MPSDCVSFFGEVIGVSHSSLCGILACLRREMGCDPSTPPRDASNVSIAESASPSISGSERVGLVRRVRGHLVSVSQQVGALAGRLEEGDAKNKVETLKGLRYAMTALFVVLLVAALMVLITNYYVEAAVGWNGTPLT